MDDTSKSTSSLHRDLCIYVVNGRQRYLVLTEDLSRDYLITTRIYLKGKVIATRKADYKHIMNIPNPEIKIRELMHSQHDQVINSLKREKSTSYYLDELKSTLHKNEYKCALQVATTALEHYPNEPFLLSYYGYLNAFVNKNYTSGIGTCLRAIDILDEKIPFGHEFFYPVLYLNLGRAYLAAGYKKDAIESFNIGHSFDNENRDLLKEIRKLGIRRKPLVAFLPRTNPINKYAGKLLHKLNNLKTA